MLDQASSTDTAVTSLETRESASGPSSEVMTLDQAARFLCISSRTLGRYVREAAIPYTPLPKRGARLQIRFLRSQLIRWLQQRTVRPDRWRSRNGQI
jgi:Helix-turn-helix domain